MRLYQLINEVVGSTQQVIPLKDRSADEVYSFIPAKNQISFTDRNGQTKQIGPVSQIVQSRKNQKYVNVVIDYHYRHVNLGLDLKKSPSFLSKLPSAALPIKIATFDTKRNKYIIKSNEQRLKRPANADVTDPAALSKYFLAKVLPTLKANCKDLFLKIEPDVSSLIRGLKEFIALEHKKKNKKPITEETYEYIANDPNTGIRKHGHIEADSEEKALRLLTNRKYKNIEITSEKDTGYYKKPGYFGQLVNKFRPEAAKKAREHSLKLGRLQSAIITQAKNILMVIKSKLDIGSLDKLYLKYKNTNVQREYLGDLYDFIRNLSNFEEILTEIAFLGQTEDKLKNTLSKAGNTESEKQRFKKVIDHSRFLAKLYDKLRDYAEY